MHWKHCILETAEDKRLYLNLELQGNQADTWNQEVFLEIEQERDFVCLIAINDGCGGRARGRVTDK